MSRSEQDRIFEQNAFIRQKIVGIVLCLATIGFWAWLMSYDVVCIWYLPLVLIAVLTGIWVVTTKRLLMKE
ncbi:MAG: hypothetical protein J6U74_01985 [Clostridia bacterium]|nr:hypothetical protein [Clostridia bacterium]